MKINIFEKAKLSSKQDDLDLMLDYVLQLLKDNGIEVNRFDKELNPEKFQKINGYALPVIEVDGEIISAGAYDFNFLDKKDLMGINRKECSIKKCTSCPGSKFCKK